MEIEQKEDNTYILNKIGHGSINTSRKKSTKTDSLSDVVKSYFDDSYKELVSFFAKEQKITTEELTEIIELIEKNRK